VPSQAKEDDRSDYGGQDDALGEEDGGSRGPRGFVQRRGVLGGGGFGWIGWKIMTSIYYLRLDWNCSIVIAEDIFEVGLVEGISVWRVAIETSVFVHGGGLVRRTKSAQLVTMER